MKENIEGSTEVSSMNKSHSSITTDKKWDLDIDA